MLQGAVDGHGGSSSIMGSRCAYAAQSGLLLGGVSSHLNARNKTRFALATEEFVTLFLSANWTSCQAKRSEATICHTRSLSHREVAVQWLTWRHRLRNCRGGSNENYNAEMTTTTTTMSAASIRSNMGTDAAAPLHQWSLMGGKCI